MKPDVIEFQKIGTRSFALIVNEYGEYFWRYRDPASTNLMKYQCDYDFDFFGTLEDFIALTQIKEDL